MEGYIEVARRGDLQPGTLKRAFAGSLELTLARVGDEFYATQLHCPHMGGILALGALEGTILTCPRHHSQFDVRDGHVVRWTDWTGLVAAVNRVIKPPKALQTYPVRLEGDAVLVKPE